MAMNVSSSQVSTPPHQVIIVGGGPVGLSCSILLSLRNIPHILFERHPDTSIHPKACGINQRTTEIFRVMGIEEEVYQHAAPDTIAGRTAWYTGFGPHGRELYSRDAWGGGKYASEYASHSPSKYCIMPQIRLEPILKRRAVELNPHGIFYNTEVLDSSNDESEGVVRVIVQSRSNGEKREYVGQYAILADGGRMFTDKLGVRWSGEGELFDMVTAHFSSPLRSLHPDPRNFMTWFSNPSMGGSTRTGYLYQIGPWPSMREEDDEYVFACGRATDDPDSFDAETMVARLRRTLGIPDLPINMLTFSHWTVNALFAERWRVGRIFLVGDAAHRIPPWGALGMNTGIQDAQNLIWKLCLALEDPNKYDRLLDTYQTERLEVGKRVGLTSLENMRRHSNLIDTAIGISEKQTAQQNCAEVDAFFDPAHPDYAGKRAAMEMAARELDSEFKAPGYEVGWFYPSVDSGSERGKTHGGQQHPDGTLVYEFYRPSTIPGHHLPHVWVERDGKQCALRDLLTLKNLTLIVEHVIRVMDSRVSVVVVGADGWTDISGTWEQVRGVGASGGVLVRPDGIVAWRGLSSDVEAQVDRILCAKSEATRVNGAAYQGRI
ncbi:hypothetical protein LTR09_005122 [Extremus antarcticus]|uniref:FAD-binding domain-containing protein n=1 Tax=Extremus antarcticus TaxID=702011 RepID=A0AAJ0DH97_9PEZI|nr:hypothetical protein LTR09_005122 [Extremus antarcticus]